MPRSNPISRLPLLFLFLAGALFAAIGSSAREDGLALSPSAQVRVLLHGLRDSEAVQIWLTGPPPQLPSAGTSRLGRGFSTGIPLDGQRSYADAALGHGDDPALK